MVLKIDTVYKQVQSLFKKGLVIVVGSGASCADGIPGMGELGKYLCQSMPSKLATSDKDAKEAWKRISTLLRGGSDLETALSPQGVVVPEEVSSAIVKCTAECIGKSESSAIITIVRDTSLSPLGKLLKYALRTEPCLNVITTNYDRLIETKAAKADIPVDSGFYGHTLGRFDAMRSLAETSFVATKSQYRAMKKGSQFQPHIRIAKPHGSLDWFSVEGKYYRTDIRIDAPPQIVPPGPEKYRAGYEILFDEHRRRANDAIDKASGFLFYGYGFNDDHLQKHMDRMLQKIPSVIVARDLTKRALEHLARNPLSLGIESVGFRGDSRAVFGGDEVDIDFPLWELQQIVERVLKL